MVSEKIAKRIRELEWWIRHYGEVIDKLGVTDNYEEADFDRVDGPLYISDDYVIGLSEKLEELDELYQLHPEMEWS